MHRRRFRYLFDIPRRRLFLLIVVGKILASYSYLPALYTFGSFDGAFFSQLRDENAKCFPASALHDVLGAIDGIQLSIDFMRKYSLAEMLGDKVPDEFPLEFFVFLRHLEGPERFLHGLFPVNVGLMLQVALVAVLIFACNVAKSAVPPDFCLGVLPHLIGNMRRSSTFMLRH